MVFFLRWIEQALSTLIRCYKTSQPKEVHGVEDDKQLES